MSSTVPSHSVVRVESYWCVHSYKPEVGSSVQSGFFSSVAGFKKITDTGSLYGIIEKVREFSPQSRETEKKRKHKLYAQMLSTSCKRD